MKKGECIQASTSRKRLMPTDICFDANLLMYLKSQPNPTTYFNRIIKATLT